MKEIKYLESHGLRIVTLHQGLSPVGFQVVKTSNEVVFESKTLYEAENFIVSGKMLTGGITVGSAAEVKMY